MLKNSIRKNLDFFINMDKEEVLLQRKINFYLLEEIKALQLVQKLSDNLSMKTNIIDKFINKLYLL